MRLFPSPAEVSSLRFLLAALPGVRTRFAAAGGLFLAGLSLWCLADGIPAVAGLALILAGHLPLWARTETNAPGGATPAHEEVWAPVEEGWLARVRELERRGARWDTTPWDLSNKLGFLTLAGLLAATRVAAVAADGLLQSGILIEAWTAVPFLLVPLWLNGMRTVWNPSELLKKGEALDAARAQFQAIGGEDFDLVPMLALREGRRGRYPVDARVMLRPAVGDGSSFLGVQIQVAMNNVQGTDYPYLYAVVLGKDAFRLPAQPAERWPSDAVKLVFEEGAKEGVRFLVIRQHADKSGGWHTKPEHVRELVRVAIAAGREAWRENRAGGA
jgi:hypothetical protein